MIHPSIDHSLLSPAGRMSGSARKAALKREHARLFPPGFFDYLKPTPEQIRAERVAGLRRSAADLRALADRGMTPRKFRKAAERMEVEAAEMESA